MKTLLCTLAIAVGLHFSLSAQGIFEPGYFVSHDDDTTFCEVKYRSWKARTLTIDVKIDGELKRFAPTDIASFYVRGGLYKSAFLQVKKYKRGVIRHRTDTAFVCVLVEGPKSLYFYKGKQGNEHFFIKKGTEFVALNNRAYKIEHPLTKDVVKTALYKEALKDYFSDCLIGIREIERTAFETEELVDIFRAYYACKGSNPDHIVDLAITKRAFGLVAGLGRETIRFTENTGWPSWMDTIMAAHNFPASYNPDIGFFLQYPRQRNFGRLSFLNENTFSIFKSNASYEYQAGENQRHVYDTKISFVKLTVAAMGRYRFSFREGEGPFIQAGLVGSFLKYNYRQIQHYYIDGNYSMSNYSWYQGRFNHIWTSVGGAVGLGYLKNNYFLELRSEFPTSDFMSLRIRRSGLYLLAGYTF